MAEDVKIALLTPEAKMDTVDLIFVVQLKLQQLMVFVLPAKVTWYQINKSQIVLTDITTNYLMLLSHITWNKPNT